MKTKVKKISLFIAIGFLFAIVIGPFLVPVPPLEASASPQDLADADSRFIEVDGTQIHYKIKGQGEPVLILMHGFGSSLYTWMNAMDGLAEEATVIAFDRPAYGLSERPLTWEGANPYAPEMQLAQIEGLMDALGIEQAILVGNSAGGTVAAAFALEHPERVAGLVLVDAAIYSGGGAPEWVKPILRTPQMRHLGPLIARRLLSQSDRLLALAWHDPTRISPELLAAYEKPTQIANWDKALWEFTLASRDWDLEARLAEISTPTLVISGDDDRIVPTEQSIRLAGEINGAALVVIPDCGHVPQEECPAEFLRAVEEFLAQR